MDIKILNAKYLKMALTKGLEELIKQEKIINNLNVFPVPDGDTGSNMRLTLENGLKNANDVSSLKIFSKDLAKGMLLGARGNSGVILSQLFKGFSLVLCEYDEVDSVILKNALIQSYKTAYASVVGPKEGTLLTVAREGIEFIKDEITDQTTINQLLLSYYKQMIISLEDTPNKLDVLKEAGVIDSGGAGIVAIYKGILQFLNEDDIPTYEIKVENSIPRLADTEMEYGYCTEFIFEIQNKETKKPFDKALFQEYLESIGNSIVLIEDDGIVKVHVHTLTPGDALSYAQQYGEFINIKVENMQLQHNEVIANQKPTKKIGYIAVAQGDGVANLFKNFGCDVVLDGGKTMNTSSNEFVNAINQINAESYIILPNNKNIILAAKQAAELTGKNIEVLNTRSIAEGYFALSMSDTNDEDVEFEQQIENMKMGFETARTLSVCKSVRNAYLNKVDIKDNNYFSLLDDEALYSSEDIYDVIYSSLEKIEEIDDYSVLIVFKGNNISDDDAQKLIEELEDKYPFFQIGLIEESQELYDFVIGLS